MKDTHSHPIKRAWDETFETENQKFHQYFLGWPTSESIAAKIAYFILAGWLLTFAKNMVKLLTEFPLFCIYRTTDYLIGTILDKKGDESDLAFLALLSSLRMLSRTLHFIVCAVTSPLKNFKKYRETSPFLSILSLVISVGAYAALFFFAPPVIASIGAKIGLATTLNIIANSAIASKIAYPFVWGMGKIGAFVGSSLFATTPTLVGAMIFTLASTFVATVNGIREAFSSSKGPKGFVEVPIEQAPSKENLGEKNSNTKALEKLAGNKPDIENNLNDSTQEQNNNSEQTNTPILSTDTSENSSGQGSDNSLTSAPKKTSSESDINNKSSTNNIGNNEYGLFSGSNKKIPDGADQEDNNSKTIESSPSQSPANTY